MQGIGNVAQRACPGGHAPQCFEGALTNMETNQNNTGLASVDRSTMATLNTYNTRIQISRVQQIYHFHCTPF